MQYIALEDGLPKLVDNPELASHFVLAVGGPATPHLEARPLKPPAERDVLLRVVAEHYGAKVSDLKSGSRRQRLCQARHVASYLLRRHQLLTWCEIGELLQRDHTTIMHGAKKVQRQADKDPKLFKGLQDLAAAAQTQMWSEA